MLANGSTKATIQSEHGAVCEAASGPATLAASLKEIREFARSDVTARPQIVSRRFPANLEWQKYSRREQATMLRLWRIAKGVGSDQKETGKHFVSGPNNGPGKPTSPDAQGFKALGCGGGATDQRVCLPSQKTSDFDAEEGANKSAERRNNKPRRNGKACTRRRTIRRIYDSLCVAGYSFVHLAFEAHFGEEEIAEARAFYEKERAFGSKCTSCGSRACNHATSPTGIVRNCYRCGKDERLETPSWLQVRPN